MATREEAKVTYWYHPESDSYWMHNPAKDGPLDGAMPNIALSTEIDEYKYVAGIIDQIDKDPEHKLPEGIRGVIKSAYSTPGGGLTGIIYYDKKGSLVDGYPVNIFHVESVEPGGIYTTQSGTKYLVHLIKDEAGVTRG